MAVYDVTGMDGALAEATPPSPRFSAQAPRKSCSSSFHRPPPRLPADGRPLRPSISDPVDPVASTFIDLQSVTTTVGRGALNHRNSCLNLAMEIASIMELKFSSIVYEEDTGMTANHRVITKIS
ncbi:hypothetical protein ZWY2020_023377 [Hordeum vulgare]|nr:hypothetical protein ZWY2020_023377 [Hordeum vulgare]